VKDANGNIVSGAAVVFAVASGGGSLTGATAGTNSAGVASLISWTLGTRAGTNTLSATVGSLSPISFAATGIAGPPAVVSKIAGDGQTTTVGSQVPVAPSVTVADVNGNAVADASVTFSVSAGGGSITGASVQTSSSGVAAPSSWTLGIVAGANSLSATVGSLPAVTFTATGRAGPPTSISIVAGNNQTAVAGSTLTPITISARDRYSNLVPSADVAISVSAGGGSVTPSTATTDASGTVSNIQWHLGKSAVAQALSIVAADSITVTVNATVSTNYSAEVRFFGPTQSAATQALFLNAEARIRGIITGALTSVVVSNLDLDTNCGVTGVTISETIPGVLVYVEVKSIDGPGKILAQAGPCFIRSTNRLTIIGVMQFDSDDLPYLQSGGRLQDVVQHEMLHVIGVGTLWDQTMPSLITGAGTLDPRFTGSLGGQACLAAGGTSLCTAGVAVENCIDISGCEAGTQDSHWREGTSTLPGFHTELMTGYAEAPGVPMPLSNITVQSLGDLGYAVNSLAADAYSVPSPSLRALASPDPERAWNIQEVVLKPRGQLSSNGTMYIYAIPR
jgi:hypothetical protein